MILENLTIQHWLTQHARYRGSKTALIFDQEQLTYKELNNSVNQLIHAWQEASIGKGDKVATLLPNSVELWEVYWACAKTGAVAVPLSNLLRGQGLANLLLNADTKLLITTKEMINSLREVNDQLSGIPPQNFWLINEEYSQEYQVSLRPSEWR